MKFLNQGNNKLFFHELTHAILFAMRKDDLYEDESFVNTFSSFFQKLLIVWNNNYKLW